MPSNEQLQILRNEIDQYDKLIVDALLQRKKLSRRIQRFKKSLGLACRDIQREEQILKGLTSGHNVEDEKYLRAVYLVILKNCVKSSAIEKSAT